MSAATPRILGWTPVVLLLCARLALADPTASVHSASELKRLSLEDLFDVEVTLVSKRPQKLSETASAIQIITSEDIRRSGALHVADALRLVANAGVQQINSYAWVVSARGFNALFANKLLVMIDGRSVYTPLDAGVFWDAQNVLLEDIDRIEVISGPGGALWGANAVNGVINIITKRAEATQGFYASGGAGSFDQSFGSARYGGRLGASTSYRVFAQNTNRNATIVPGGDEGTNDWHLAHGGFRLDHQSSESNQFTLQGEGYAGEEFNTPTAHSTLDGQFIMGRWTHTRSAKSSVELRFYADRTWRRDIPSTFADQLETYDGEFQHRLPWGTRHDVLWGLGYRLMDDHAETTTIFVGFLPPRRLMRLYSGFVQDEVTLVPNRLRVTIGTKLEHQTYSGFELLPSLRLAWTPNSRQTAWAAVSRAVRSPSRIDVDYFIPKVPPYGVAGGPEFESEQLVAYEAGYRAQPGARVTLGLATFYNHYEDIYSVEPRSSASLFPYTIQNGIAGDSWGFELSGAFQPADSWRVRGGYTYFEKHLWSQPGHNAAINVIESLGNDPRNQVALQSMVDLGSLAQLDLTGRYVDALFGPKVPDYIAIDVRAAARWNHWELEVVGQNLTDTLHPEFSMTQETPRSVYGRLTTRW